MKIKSISISLGETIERKTTTGKMLYHKVNVGFNAELDEDDMPLNVAGEWEEVKAKASDMCRTWLKDELNKFDSINKLK